MSDQLVPVVMPPTLGSSSRNGDRCRWQPQSALEQACLHLGLHRRRPQCGWCGQAVLTADATWRFNLQVEPYTLQMVAVICYSTSSPSVTATFDVVTPVDPGSAELQGTTSSAAGSHIIVRVPVTAANFLSADAALEPFTCSVTTIASSDAEETAPSVTVWSVHWTTDRVSAADIT